MANFNQEEQKVVNQVNVNNKIETLKIKVWISTDRQGSLCEDFFFIEKERWNSISSSEKENICKDIAFNMGEWGYEEA